MKLALGTVQFGLSYGIANSCGQVKQEEASAILALAKGSGIDTLDTAISYGDSERCLGASGVADWRVISKLPAVPEGATNVAAWVLGEVQASLQRLRISRLHGLLLHRPAQLLDQFGGELYGALTELKRQGLVEKIGVSIYDPSELDLLLQHFELDLVQAPFNVIDRRLVTSGWMQRLAEMNIELHARSVFLQGLLLMSAEKRPATFDCWRSTWQCWEQWLVATGLTPLQACLRDALAQDGIARVIVGVDSLEQFKEILQSATGYGFDLPAALYSNDLDLINPARWKDL